MDSSRPRPLLAATPPYDIIAAAAIFWALLPGSRRFSRPGGHFVRAGRGRHGGAPGPPSGWAEWGASPRAADSVSPPPPQLPLRPARG